MKNKDIIIKVYEDVLLLLDEGDAKTQESFRAWSKYYDDDDEEQFAIDYSTGHWE